MSLSAEEFANDTLKLILSEFSAFAAQTVPHPMIYYPIHPRSHTIATSQYVGDTCHANEKGQGHVRPISSGERFFTSAINTPSLLTSFLLRSTSLPCSSSQTLVPPLLPSSPVRKSFTASTSSPSYSRRPRISSLCHSRSSLPLPS